MRAPRIAAAIGTTCALALMVSACGSDGGSTPASGGSATIKVGLLSSLSGPASSTFAPSVEGVNARFAAYKDGGGKCASTTFDIVKADDTSSPQGALSAAQKLTQQDKVYALLETTATFYGAAPFLTTTGKATPVIGAAQDGATQWLTTSNNLIPSSPVPNYDQAFTSIGQYLKSVGGTKIAGVSYEHPASQGGIKIAMISAAAAGISKGYLNTSVPIGSTDVGAIVLGIISSKSDVLDMTINPDTAFAVIAGLKQANYPMKSIISATGYGSDILDSPPALQAAQGVTFQSSIAPIELKTPATELLSSSLKKYAGSASGIPGYAQGVGWLAADLFLHGLDLAGCDATSAKFLSTLRADKTWNAGGLYATPMDFTTTTKAKECAFYLTLKDKTFVPAPGASPICGTPVS